MEAKIFNIKKFAIHDGPGIRTTIFFKGCPLKCFWCHNPESISSLLENSGRSISLSELIIEIEKERIFYDESGGGVTFSGGEPLLQNQFLLKILKYCFENDIHTTVDTSGYVKQEVLNRVVPYTNLFLYDLKLMDSNLHKKYTGVNNDQIKENLYFLGEKQKNIIIRIPVIPEINTSEAEITSFILFLKSILLKYPALIKEINLLPYHNLGLRKWQELDHKPLFKPDILKTPDNEFLTCLKERLSENLNINAKIGG